MKYDVVIIGGGLSGLIAGIQLAKHGRSVAIVSFGQSALHFCSGSFGLLGSADGRTLLHPLDGIASLKTDHPYSKIGAERVEAYADTMPALFADAGITLKGSCRKNHRILTPMGKLKSAWLSMAEFATFDAAPEFGKARIVNFRGYADFYPAYLSDGLAKIGVSCRCSTIEIDAVERLRRSSGEMRAASLARLLRGDVLVELAGQINKSCRADDDIVLMPAVVGFDSEEHIQALRRLVVKPLRFVPTTPMSACGLRAQLQLRRQFERLGGSYFLGDCIDRIERNTDGSIARVYSRCLADDAFEADSYILAGGGLFSRGIIAEPHRIAEPLFGADVEAPINRDEWFAADFFAPQPYMSYGISTDKSFHPLVDGKPIANLYACGAILGGANPLEEGSGAGIAILTALHVSNTLLYGISD